MARVDDLCTTLGASRVPVKHAASPLLMETSFRLRTNFTLQHNVASDKGRGIKVPLQTSRTNTRQSGLCYKWIKD